MSNADMLALALENGPTMVVLVVMWLDLRRQVRKNTRRLDRVERSEVSRVEYVGRLALAVGIKPEESL